MTRIPTICSRAACGVHWGRKKKLPQHRVPHSRLKRDRQVYAAQYVEDSDCSDESKAAETLIELARQKRRQTTAAAVRCADASPQAHCLLCMPVGRIRMGIPSCGGGVEKSRQSFPDCGGTGARLVPESPVWPAEGGTRDLSRSRGLMAGRGGSLARSKFPRQRVSRLTSVPRAAKNAWEGASEI